jgi:hypothetical protein
MMDLDVISSLVASMSAMKYFPSDPAARLAIVETITDIARDEDEVRWLVKRMRTLYPEWPGEREMRACFCSRFPPRDGINAHSAVFHDQDGIPSEVSERNLIGGRAMLALPAGKLVSSDPELERVVKDLVRANHFSYGERMYGPATSAEIARAPYWLRKLEGYEP